MILAYRVLTNILYPVILIILIFRVFLKKEDPNRYKEKIFVKHFNVRKNINLKLVWFHAASIGEFKSIIPIIKSLNERENIEFLITTTTLSSGNLAKEEFKKFENVHHRFMPFDINHLVEKFLNSWKPEKIFLVDSEIWPNLILKAKQKKISIALINARLTERSFHRWCKFPKTAEKIFDVFDLCLCSNNETKKFLEVLKAKNIKYAGNIKLINEIKTNALNENNHKILANSRFWIAASIHKNEDTLCLNTHIELKKKYKDIITIIAPRHINRVKKIKSLSENLNLKTQILNENENIFSDTEVVIINAFGVLQDYFQLAKSVFIGKSTIKNLKNDSGQNPIDAAYLNCKVYHGPYVSNFNEIYEILKKNNISNKIENYYELSKNLALDLKKSGKIFNQNSNSVHSIGKKVLQNTMEIINNFLNDKN